MHQSFQCAVSSASEPLHADGVTRSQRGPERQVAGTLHGTCAHSQCTPAWWGEESVSCTVWVKIKCAHMCAQLCILRADCAQVHDVCMCGGVPCAHTRTKPEFVHDPSKMCIFKCDCTGPVEVACIGGFGVRAPCARRRGHAFLHGDGPRGGVVKNIQPNQFYSRSGKLLIVDYDFWRYSIRILL